MIVYVECQRCNGKGSQERRDGAAPCPVCAGTGLDREEDRRRGSQERRVPEADSSFGEPQQSSRSPT